MPIAVIYQNLTWKGNPKLITLNSLSNKVKLFSLKSTQDFSAMIKILHTADWHLGKRLQDFSRMEEQNIHLAKKLMTPFYSLKI